MIKFRNDFYNYVFRHRLLLNSMEQFRLIVQIGNIMRSIKIVFFVFTFFAFSFSCAAAGQKKFNKTFPVTPGGKLIVKTDAGSINVAGTSDNIISVTADIEGSDKAIAEFEVTAEQKDNEITIHGKNNRNGLWPWNWAFGRSLQVEFTIHVPKKIALQLNTSGGGVRVNSIEGSITGSTSGGDIGMSEIKGELEFSTSGGDVFAERCSGIIRSTTCGGNINATELTGIIEMNTSGGNIRMSAIEGSLRTKTLGGSIFVNLKGENKGVYTETMGGSIMLEVPKNFAANIEANTFGGRVRCDLSITTTGKLENNKIIGTINGGGALINAHTMGGNVWIKGVE
jgi:hypothetical protein